MSLDKLKKLAAKEEEFLNQDFFSPVLNGQPVRVRIDGVVMHLNVIRPKNYEGWGIFRPLDHRHAKKIRNANIVEKNEYLKLFPILRLIVCARTDEQWYGIPANQADERFKVSGMVPISLPEELQMFNTIQTRFDGSNCWFDQIDMSQNPRNAVMLREALAELRDIEKIDISGLSKEEKRAYNVAIVNEIENRKDLTEERIKEAVHRAGGEYRSYMERGNTFTVEYSVDGENHRSVVNKDTLSVESAGICLSGGDRAFDLQSVVGVIREGIDRRSIYRTDREDDW